MEEQLVNICTYTMKVSLYLPTDGLWEIRMVKRMYLERWQLRHALGPLHSLDLPNQP